MYCLCLPVKGKNLSNNAVKVLTICKEHDIWSLSVFREGCTYHTTDYFPKENTER